MENKSPLSKYTIEECANMPLEEFYKLLDAHNEYVHKKYERLAASNEPEPEFNSIEELRAYYHCRPLDEVVKNVYKLFDLDDPGDVSHLDDVSNLDEPDNDSYLDD